jgi:hypothetical protein
MIIETTIHILNTHKDHGGFTLWMTKNYLREMGNGYSKKDT